MMAAGMLGRLARPVAKVVAKKTGLPVANVTRVLEVALPVVAAVITKKAAGRKKPKA